MLDPSRQIHRIYGTRAEAMYLVRPDRYISFCAAPPAWEPLREYIARIFSAQPSADGRDSSAAVAFQV